MEASSPYLNRPCRTLAQVEAERAARSLCELGGLHRCPHVTGWVEMCGCAPGSCDATRASRRNLANHPDRTRPHELRAREEV